MKVFSSLQKPEYIFRPSQIWRRFFREFITPGEFADVMLPWEHSIRVRPQETIGSCIWRVGIYDLCVSECLWRLIDPGEIAVDIGANIGHMTSVMSRRAGQHGRIISIEPHPELFEELHFNVVRWENLKNSPEITLHSLALSDRVGRALLHVPQAFSTNRGTAYLRVSDTKEPASEAHSVFVSTLDALIPGKEEIGVLKIDVEGQELAVLRGGEELLRNKRVRDIVFEYNEMMPIQATEFLGGYGYSVFHLGKGFSGPEVVDVQVPYVRRCNDAQSFLATIDPQRALNRLRLRGWRVLRGGTGP